MRTEIIRVEDAVGRVLCHDITRIVKDNFKGTAYKKGHVITPGDIPELLKLGKEHVFVLELEPGEIHEDEAGIRLGRVAAGSGTVAGPVKESRVNIYADIDGLLKIDIPSLEAINELPQVILSTLASNSVVNKGELLAGTKVIPLVIEEEVINEAERIGNEAQGIIRVIPFKSKKAAILVTGSEVYKGRITDTFGPVLAEKVRNYGSQVVDTVYAPDDADFIAREIKRMANDGAEIIFVSGGMSVDPDDVTPSGIKMSGAELVKYGAPALPGAMFLMAYLGDTAVMGIPACGMYFKITVLDLLLPRILAGEKITSRDIIKLAHGGLCRSCAEGCRYPNCSFGKGATL